MKGGRRLTLAGCAAFVGACVATSAHEGAPATSLMASGEATREPQVEPVGSPAAWPPATPSPSPSSSPDWGNPLLVYTVTPPGRTDTDIAVLDRPFGQSYRFPAITGRANERRGKLKDHNQVLYFLTDAPGTVAVWRLDLRTQLIDALPEVNQGVDVTDYDASADGNILAYSVRTPAGDRLRRFLLPSRQVEVPALMAKVPLDGLTLSDDGAIVVYATPAFPGGPRDLGLYDFALNADRTPPFVNGPADDHRGALDDDNRRLVFVSNRRGTNDLYLADLLTGRLEALVNANSAGDENSPRFSSERVIRFTSDRTGGTKHYFYFLDTQLLDTVPLEVPVEKP